MSKLEYSKLNASTIAQMILDNSVAKAEPNTQSILLEIPMVNLRRFAARKLGRDFLTKVSDLADSTNSKKDEFDIVIYLTGDELSLKVLVARKDCYACPVQATQIMSSFKLDRQTLKSDDEKRGCLQYLVTTVTEVP